MEKRLIIAVVLSVSVIAGYQLLMNKLYPRQQTVEKVLQEQQTKIKEIESIASSTGSIMVSIDDGGNNCTDNADIIITYGSHAQREQIEKIIGSDTFFGIPFRLRNI